MGALMQVDISGLINELLPIAIIGIVGMLWRIDNRLHALEFGLKEKDRRLSDAIARNQNSIAQILSFLSKASGFCYRREADPKTGRLDDNLPIVPWNE